MTLKNLLLAAVTVATTCLGVASLTPASAETMSAHQASKMMRHHRPMMHHRGRMIMHRRMMHHRGM
jgi:hypothetical protein